MDVQLDLISFSLDICGNAETRVPRRGRLTRNANDSSRRSAVRAGWSARNARRRSWDGGQRRRRGRFIEYHWFPGDPLDERIEEFEVLVLIVCIENGDWFVLHASVVSYGFICLSTRSTVRDGSRASPASSPAERPYSSECLAVPGSSG